MKQTVTAVFDIGKTNKKFFLFDNDFQEVYREYIQFDEIVDEDGYPSDNLEALQHWLKELFNRILASEAYDVTAINFSSYGASFVHLDENGEVLTPIYNYTKPFPESINSAFYDKYGPEMDFSIQTGSIKYGMLNSGMQLYWLKYHKPDVFKKIRYSLHLPQYLSYIFTGIPLSEYTSIGCHTALWDYEKRDYHRWVYEENIHKVFPPIVSTETSINMKYNGRIIKIGVGIHDSSSALLPYIKSIKKPFILVSTGTWSIVLNPFAVGKLSEEDLSNGCINYMLINGDPIKSSRLFLGNEHKHQVDLLVKHFGVPADYHKGVKFDFEIFSELSRDFKQVFDIGDMFDQKPKAIDIPYSSFEYAYHQLMMELVMLEIQNIKNALGESKIKKLYIDGGFCDNDIYIKLLSHYLRDMSLRTTNASLGSALGAAIAISDSQLDAKFLKKNYSLKKHIPFILS